jgi:hypothetical protein
MLPCVLIGREQQEHYIVEFWCEQLGWSKIETTLGIFPLDDFRHLILRVTYPDSPRTPGCVPSRRPEGQGLTCSFGPKPGQPLRQSAEILEQCSLGARDVDFLEATARDAFEHLSKEASMQPMVELLAAPELTKRISGRGKKLLKELKKILDE